MIEHDGKVKLAGSEFNRLRRAAAKRGYAINQITTTEDYENALILASSPGLVADLLEVLTTGSSRLTRGEITYDSLIEP